MYVLTTSCPLFYPGGFVVRGRKQWAPFATTAKPGGGFQVSAFLFNANREPILKHALKEPIAFMGGIFAGILRLDLNDDPLKEWITRTVEASGITGEEVSSGEAQADESPEQIQIE